MWLFLIFVAVPILEIALFIQAGGIIGLWPTLGVVVLTAIVGTTLVRQQGLSTLDKLRRSLAEGTDPSQTIAHGALILAAGLLLLTPGFFTDAVGLSLMVPPVRAALIAYGAKHLSSRITVYGMQETQRPYGDDSTIDAEYTVETEDETKPGTSGWTRPG